MSKDFSRMTPSEILRWITNACICEKRAKEMTYIILGKPGPTGKTWLTQALRDRGYKAIEISEEVYDMVDYHDDKNHFIEDPYGRHVTIILNRPCAKKKIEDNVQNAYNVLHNVYSKAPIAMKDAMFAIDDAMVYLKDELDRRQMHFLAESIPMSYVKARLLWENLSVELATYGVVTVADYYKFAGILDDNPDTNNYGWTDLSEVKIKELSSDSYMLVLPLATYRAT